MDFSEEIKTKIKSFYEHLKTPKYACIDLAKHLIADYVLSSINISQTSTYCFIYSDLDHLQPLTRESIFDDTTKDILTRQPFLPCSVNNITENSFFIIVHSKIDQGSSSKSGQEINRDIILTAAKRYFAPYIGNQAIFGLYRGSLAKNGCLETKEMQFPDSHFFNNR